MLASASAQCMYEYVTYVWSIDPEGTPKLLFHANGADLSRLKDGIIDETEPARWADGKPDEARMSDFLRRRGRYDPRLKLFVVGNLQIIPTE